MKNTLRYLCIAAVLVLLASCATPPEPAETSKEAPNPFVGTWKLNVETSIFNPPSSALKSDIVVVEAIDNGLKFTFDRVDAEGNATHIEEAPKFDGNEYPVTGDETSMVKLMRVDAHSFGQEIYRNGELSETVQVVVAEDGMSSTATSTTKDENGQDVTTVTHYDKQ